MNKSSIKRYGGDTTEWFPFSKALKARIASDRFTATHEGYLFDTYPKNRKTGDEILPEEYTLMKVPRPLLYSASNREERVKNKYEIESYSKCNEGFIAMTSSMTKIILSMTEDFLHAGLYEYNNNPRQAWKWLEATYGPSSYGMSEVMFKYLELTSLSMSNEERFTSFIVRLNELRTIVTVDDVFIMALMSCDASRNSCKTLQMLPDRLLETMKFCIRERRDYVETFKSLSHADNEYHMSSTSSNSSHTNKQNKNKNIVQTSPPTSSANAITNSSGDGKKFTGECHVCGKTGHYGRDCRSIKVKTCDHCGKKNHNASDCRIRIAEEAASAKEKSNAKDSNKRKLVTKDTDKDPSAKLKRVEAEFKAARKNLKQARASVNEDRATASDDSDEEDLKDYLELFGRTEEDLPPPRKGKLNAKRVVTINGIRQGLNSLVDTYHNTKQDIALLDSGADKTVTRHLDLLKNSTLESFSAENPGIYLQAANGERMTVTHSGDISPYITDALRSHDVGDITLVSASEIREMDVGSILLPRSMIPQG